MTVTPDDSTRLQHLGIVILTNLANLSTLTLLHGNEAKIYAVDALTIIPFHIRHIHNSVLYRCIHQLVCLIPC